MRYLIGFLFLMLSLSAHSKPAAEIFFDGMARHDAALVSNAGARCAALFTVQAAVIMRDANDEEMANGFLEAASDLHQSMMATNGMIKVKRGVEVTQEMKDSLLNDVEQQSVATIEFYTDRMRANQLSVGEMWGQDELIKSDMEFCPTLKSVMTSDAWAKTLLTNDWSFWDNALAN